MPSRIRFVDFNDCFFKYREQYQEALESAETTNLVRHEQDQNYRQACQILGKEPENETLTRERLGIHLHSSEVYGKIDFYAGISVRIQLNGLAFQTALPVLELFGEASEIGANEKYAIN